MVAVVVAESAMVMGCERNTNFTRGYCQKIKYCVFLFLIFYSVLFFRTPRGLLWCVRANLIQRVIFLGCLYLCFSGTYYTYACQQTDTIPVIQYYSQYTNYFLLCAVCGGQVAQCMYVNIQC